MHKNNVKIGALIVQFNACTSASASEKLVQFLCESENGSAYASASEMCESAMRCVKALL